MSISRPETDQLTPQTISTGVSAEQMKLVLDVSRMLAVTSDLDKLLLRIAEATTALLDCERASIFLHDPKTDELWTKIALQSAPIRLPSSKGIVGHAFTGNQILHVPNPYQDSRFNPGPDKATGFVTRNLLTAPMVDWQRKPVGVIQAVNKRSDRGFSDGDSALVQLLADQAGVAIQRYHLQQAATESMVLRHEMELAKHVQEASLPPGAVATDKLEAEGWTRAASINGGDCYDLWKLTDGTLGVLVADASGHGIAPALVVSQVRALVRTLADIEADAGKILTRVNARLVNDLTNGRFCTVFLAFIDPDGRVDWRSAGHSPILIQNGTEFISLEPRVPPVAILDEMIFEDEDKLQIEPGGLLVISTDGITEAFNPAHQMFDVPRLVETIRAAQAKSPGEIIASIRTTIDAWLDGVEQEDDQTLVVVKRSS